MDTFQSTILTAALAEISSLKVDADLIFIGALPNPYILRVQFDGLIQHQLVELSWVRVNTQYCSR